jgi:hypothetical protein
VFTIKILLVRLVSNFETGQADLAEEVLGENFTRLLTILICSLFLPESLQLQYKKNLIFVSLFSNVNEVRGWFSRFISEIWFLGVLEEYLILVSINSTT